MVKSVQINGKALQSSFQENDDPYSSPVVHSTNLTNESQFMEAVSLNVSKAYSTEQLV
jgi:hypothetical protein